MPRRVKPIPTAGENPLLISDFENENISTWFLRGSRCSQMVQPRFEIFLVPTWLRVPIWSGTVLIVSLVLQSGVALESTEASLIGCVKDDRAFCYCAS